ncbi:hypothetical protein MKX03_009549 [Papaver bracteatum]|nr:hypothetical protein MKX03_009549 [Papaver bracteatum]
MSDLRRISDECRRSIEECIRRFDEFERRIEEFMRRSEELRSHMNEVIVLDDGEVCSVCLQDLISGGDDAAVFLKWSHIFHQKCVLEWGMRKPNCPICRHDIRIDRRDKLNRKRLTHDDKEDVKPPEATNFVIGLCSFLGFSLFL